MKKTIWKYELNVETMILMPSGAEILSAHTQADSVCLWVLVDPNAEEEKRTFTVYGTGDKVKPSSEYIGTVLMCNDALVFHVFENVS